MRTGAEEIEITETGKQPKNSAHKALAGGISIYIPLSGLIDIEKEKQENEKEAEKLKPYIQNLKKRLENKNFTEKAPQEVVEKERKNLKNAQKKLEEIEKYLENLS